ncbi:hypothetical protein [Romboutsia sp.]|uniref:hypothetical protein n=1 Tax=Romboutsia sp. TaxID=1965302 RepID=UPI003F3CC5B6
MEQKLQSTEIYLNNNEKTALDIASRILGKNVSKASFNGIIGGKNGVYDVDALRYSNPSDYVNEWIVSHNQLYNKEKDCMYEKSSHRVHRLLSDNFLRGYIEQYLTRTYYKKHLGI